jgi:hypothetical protein
MIALFENSWHLGLHDIPGSNQKDCYKDSKLEHFLSMIMTMLEIVLAWFSLESLVVVVGLLA